jgi:glycosyltransferase involved in cell wall biosynthesis
MSHLRSTVIETCAIDGRLGRSLMNGHILHVSLSVHYEGVGFTSAAVELARHLPSAFHPVLYIPQVYGSLPREVQHVRLLPSILPAKIAFRPGIVAWARKRNERNLLHAVQRQGEGALVWLWPGASIELQRALKQCGAVIIREMINTHSGTARRILDAEYTRLNLPLSHDVTDATVQSEIDELAISDFIVSPSESVDESLLEWNIREDRIIRSTFGWGPGDFAGSYQTDLQGEGLKVIFVGQAGVRKGIHLALAAWDQAKINGTFFVVGRENPDISPLLAPYRDRQDIRFMPFTRDLASLYRAADLMFFPTLEEGAPLVCYQAGGCGLPILTGPMGRGRLVEDGVTGFIVDPHDVDAMAERLQQLEGDEALRKRLGGRIKERALQLDWSSVAAARARAFGHRLGI